MTKVAVRTSEQSSEEIFCERMLFNCWFLCCFASSCRAVVLWKSSSVLSSELERDLAFGAKKEEDQALIRKEQADDQVVFGPSDHLTTSVFWIPVVRFDSFLAFRHLLVHWRSNRRNQSLFSPGTCRLEIHGHSCQKNIRVYRYL